MIYTYNKQALTLHKNGSDTTPRPIPSMLIPTNIPISLSFSLFVSFTSPAYANPTGTEAENKPFKKFMAQYGQKLFRIRYFRTHPRTVPYRQKRRQGLRPLMSDTFPMIREAIATPRRADIGTKYVAAEKPNGSVLGNESRCAPGRTIMLQSEQNYNMWKKSV
jgi:hypothetical protein